MAWPPPEPVTTSTLTCLIDALTGEVLWSKSPDTQHSNASTTKWVSVALICKIISEKVLANRNGDRPGLEQVITIDSSHMVGGSSGGLKANDQLTLQDALHAAIKVSANEAITAAAGFIGYQYLGAASTALNSGVAAFVGQMNLLAAQLGLTNSHFVTPSGLDRAGHYMSARDLANMVAYAVTLPLMVDIWSKHTWRTLITRSGSPFEMIWDAHIAGWAYPGQVACKAGDTPTCNALAICAQRGNTKLIAAFIMDQVPVGFIYDVRAMLDYGFRIKREYSEAVAKLHENSSYIGYNTAWNRSGYFPDLYDEGFTMIATNPTQIATSNVRGTRLQWYTYKGSSRGKGEIWLDGNLDLPFDLFGSFAPYLGYDRDFGAHGDHSFEIRPNGKNSGATNSIVEIDFLLLYDSIPTDSLVSGAIVEGSDTVAGGISLSFPVDPGLAVVIQGGWQEPDETVIGSMHFVPPEVPEQIPTPSQSCRYRACFNRFGWCIFGVGSEFFHIQPGPGTTSIILGKSFARGDLVFGAARTRPAHFLTDWTEEEAA